MQEVTEPSVVRIVRLTKTGSEFLFSLGQQNKRQNHADSCPDWQNEKLKKEKKFSDHAEPISFISKTLS